jgi:xylulokinase
MLLGIDLGTGSVKALLLAGGAVVGEAARSYRVEAARPGWAETAPEHWWRATVAAVQEVTAGRAGEVSALGLSGQMHGVVLAADSGGPLYPAILWADGRSGAQLSLYRALKPSLLAHLANPLATGMAGPSLLWLKRHEPQSYARARWALQPKDWLRLRLAGEACAEPSDASATLLYDLKADDWSHEVIEALELRADFLAPLVPSGSIAGQLTAEAARALGLPAGLPVAAGAADTAAAALGGGLITPGEVQLTVGTAAQLTAPRDEPMADPEFRTHLFRAATPEGFYALAAIQNAGLALEWARGVLKLSWPEMYDSAFAAPPGSAGLTFLPYLTGERTPHLDPEIRGAWLGLGLHHGPGHLARAAFEGVAFSLRDGLRALEDVGISPQALKLAGGGTLEPRWRQLLADVLRKPLLASSAPAASARGAALLAGLATGVYRDAQATLNLLPPPRLVAEPGPANEGLEEAWLRYRGYYPKLRAEESPIER